MELQQKQEIVSSIKEKLKNYSCAIIADFQGMDVASMQKLRQEIRRRGLELTVVKNTLLTKASADYQYSEDLKTYLKGMTAVAWSPDDPSAPAKVIKDYQKEDERLKIKCGIMDGKILSPTEVDTLATLPSKEQVLAGFLSLLIAPTQQFLTLLQTPIKNLLFLFKNYKDAKEGN